MAPKPPRIGVCNMCRAVVPFDIDRTVLHHEAYHEDNPLKDTMEICQSCHMAIGWEIEIYKRDSEHYRNLSRIGLGRRYANLVDHRFDLSTRHILDWHRRWRWLFDEPYHKKRYLAMKKQLRL